MSNTKNIQRTVRIISIDKRYKKEDYPFLPVFHSSLGTYITGQHIDPKDISTKGNLTAVEIEDPSKISSEKAILFPHIILADNRVSLTHMRRFNLSTDASGDYVSPKDKAEFDFFCLQEQVAKSKDDIRPGDHYFYVEDVEAESERRITKGNLKFKAMQMIKENTSTGRYKDIALLLNSKIDKFNINPSNLSSKTLEAKLHDACDEYPEEVIACFGDSAMEDLLILKAVDYKIIERKGRAYWDGVFLGDNLTEVKKFIRNNDDGVQLKQRWMRQIGEKEQDFNSPIFHEKKEEGKVDQLLVNITMAIISKDYEKSMSAYTLAIKEFPKSKKVQGLLSEIEKLKI